MFATKTVIKGVARLHGYALYRRFLEESQRWSRDQIEAWTNKTLRSLLIAATRVPFYRERFSRVGFDPRTDFQSPRDLELLPILTKQEVREHHARLLDPSYRGPSILAHTSGTTGEPLSMRLAESFIAFDAACAFRHWSWAGYRWRQRMAALRSYVPKRHDGPRWKYSLPLNTLYLSAYHLTPENCESYIETVLAYRPRILRGYPSSIAMFAEYAWPRRKELEFVQGIFASSETLVASERETIEATFGKKLFNWYGMTEPAVILTECEQHNGMHVNWEYGHSELLPSDELPPGEYRLVTTGFHNPVMPFIRYETGDVVRSMPEGAQACPCGRTMPLVHSVAGRKDECIYTADGRRLPSLNFYTVFRKYTTIARFQLAQYGLREIVVRIEPRRGATVEPALLRQLRAELTARIGPEAQIDLQLTNKFITNADGKMPPIVRQFGVPQVEPSGEHVASTQPAPNVRKR